MKDHAALAGNYFRQGYNCAQSVVLAFAEEIGMSEEAAARTASSFGGGMGKLRQVCGAVSGALLVYGMLRGYCDPRDQKAKADHYARVQHFARLFEEKHETIICRELLKHVALKNEHTSAPDVRTDEYYKVRPCVRFVESAARILEEMLAE